MEDTQPPAWKLMKPRPTQLRPQARLGLGPPRIFYRPCLDCSSASTPPRLLRYSPTATVLTTWNSSPAAHRYNCAQPSLWFAFATPHLRLLSFWARLRRATSACSRSGLRPLVKFIPPHLLVPMRLSSAFISSEQLLSLSPWGGPRRKIKILSPPATIDARLRCLRCQTTATLWSIRIPLQSRPFSHDRGSLNDGSHRTNTFNGFEAAPLTLGSNLSSPSSLPLSPCSGNPRTHFFAPPASVLCSTPASNRTAPEPESGA